MGIHDNIEQVFGRYLAGDASEQERAEVISWLNESEKNKKEFELHQKIWNQSKIGFNSLGADIVFKDVLNKIDEHHEKEIAKSLRPTKKVTANNLIWISKIAASIAVVFAVGYFVLQSLESVEIIDDQLSTIIKQNPAGQKSKIFLPDGSEVWLNAESSISYPEKFSDSLRTVSLEGEAFFSVVKKPMKPFVVLAGEVSTVVLGTSFNINAYKTEEQTYVALQSGKVKLNFQTEGKEQEMFLEPGEGVSYDRSSRLAVKEAFDYEKLFGWKDGIIVFRDAQIDEIVNTLSRWYGVTFTVENTPKEVWDYNGTFPNQSLDNVLNSIGFTKGFTYEFDEHNPKNVTIKLN